jgi:hypothetical protein
MVGLNILLTTADGRSRPVNIIEWQHIDKAYAERAKDAPDDGFAAGFRGVPASPHDQKQ